MRALILKDLYVLWKQTRFLLLFVLVFSAIPGATYTAFGVIYAAILPYTALAYDERSKWPQLAAMLPYSDRDMVLSKFAVGWLAIGGATVISLAIHGVFSLFVEDAASDLPVVLMGACTGLCILAITLPLMFRFGVEKGRLMMFLIIFLVCASAGALGSVSVQLAPDGGYYLPMELTLALPIIALVLTALSLPLSIQLYRHRWR